MVTFRRLVDQIFLEPAYHAAPDKARVAFIARTPIADDHIDPISKISQGCFVIYPELADWNAFAKRAQQILNEANQQNDARVALLSRAGAILKDQLVRAAQLNALVRNTEMRIGQRQNNSGGVYTPPTGNDKWTIALSNCVLTAEADRRSLRINFQDMADKPGLRLSLTTLVPPPSGAQYVRLSITGNDRGLWHVPAMLDAGLLDILGVGPTYFRAKTATQIDRVTYPLFDFASGVRERFEFYFDLSDPYNKLREVARSRLELPATKLPVNLHAIHGQRLFLKAAPGASLALLRSPEQLMTGLSPPVLRKLEHHFAPQGDFELHVEQRGVDVVRLGLGASNLESASVRVGASGDLLRFSARESLVIDDKGAALAGIAPAGELPPLDGLGGLCQTSWLQIVNGKNTPQTSQLALDAEGMQAYASLGSGMMQFDPSRTALASEPLPWVPILGLSQAAGFDIERRYLSRARRRQALPKRSIVAMPSSPNRLQDELRTPQGYWASRAAEPGAFATVTFGRTLPYQPALNFPTELPDFGLRPIAGKSESATMLADLLANNRLFVVTNLSKLIKYFEPALLERIYMADWRVGWSQQRQFSPSVRDPWVILKHDNRPISELIEDAGQWSNQTGGLALSIDERGWVRERVATVLNKAKTDCLYRPTADRLTNPDWSGLLLLNLDLGAMPPQLGALEALLDGSLEVNHVGIDLNAIRPGAADRSKTAVFGLVDFEDTNTPFLPKKDPAFQIRLTKLKLLVDNDAVKEFTCQIQISIGEFLKTRVEAQNKPLTLLGCYESRVTEDGERRDSYSFSVETEKVFTFDKDSFLKSFAIRRIALVTEEKKRGKLIVDGLVAFNKIGAHFDLLGIDHLDFNDLGIHFGRIEEFVLKIDFPNIRFDFGAFNRRSGDNKPRPGSFLSKLPVKLRGFRFGEFKLPKLGYFDFSDLPEIKLVSDFKLAFDFDVDLGSLGSLAKKFERFKLNILIGWTPGNFGKLPQIAFGFRIDAGEGGGALDFGIQGIMQLTAEHFRLSSAKSPDGQDVIILAASDARLKIFSTDIPSSKSRRFDFYLFGPIKDGFSGAEKLGWYMRLKDSAAEPPIAVRSLALGQRIAMRLGADGEPKTVRKTIKWLDDQQEFGTDKDFIDFAGKPGSPLNYAPEREWFAAMAGSFFEIAEIQLLLRDPDLYGVYFELFGQKSLSIDLIYQKLADGVGRYAAEIMLPAALRNFDLGAVALTLGLIRVELYTDGGFLIDLGFPEHVDYTRSFVVQGGPFIGKGGFYIGRVPREAMPKIPACPTGQAFRVGFALRIGLGREVEKGPLRASLSVSVFGRFEGLIARKKQVALLTAEHDAHTASTTVLADDGYYVWLQGEVGIILEIEGRVDLKLIQARVLARAWLALGVTLESGQPILLHGEVGIEISLELVIGEIRIFGRTIRITVIVGYSTRLRYEWTLPARFPETVALEQAMVSGWPLPSRPDAPKPFALKLLVDISRSFEDGTAKAVLIPTAFVLDDTADFETNNPYRTLGRALIHWAVELCGKDPATVTLRRTEPLPGDPATDLFIGRVHEKLRDFDALPMALLDQFLAGLFAGSTIDIAFGTPPAPLLTIDEETPSNAKAYAFPLPPGLKLAVGSIEYDFAKIGIISDAEIAAISDALARQFAQQQAPRRGGTAVAVAADRPMVEHLFRGWCELFALTTLDTLMADWSPSEPQAMLSQLLASFKWRIAAARTGRTALGGIRIPSESGTLANRMASPKASPCAPCPSLSLYSRAGLLLDAPEGDEILRIAGISGASWVASGMSEMVVLGANAARMALADPQIKSTIVQPAAGKTVHRSFLQPPFDKVRMLDTAQGLGLLNPHSVDFTGRLLMTKSGLLPPVEYRARRMNTKSGEKVVEEQPMAAPVRAVHFEMMVDTVLRSRDVVVADCLQISGASEAERRPLDALLSRLGGGDPVARLDGATVYLGVRDAGGGIDLIEALQPDLKLARSTVSIERRPAPALAKATVSPIDEDTVFLADAQDLVRFLGLLQRAAIVNSGGTYLILPRNSLFYKKITQKAGGKLCVVILFASSAQLPPGAVNAVLLKGADAQLLDQVDDGQPRRLASRAMPNACSLKLPELFETALVREPGSALLRVWRNRSSRDGRSSVRRLDPPSAQECSKHLANLLDMLEFGVERDGKSLLDIDRSLPLASEEAIPAEATAEQIADLIATLPKDSVAGDLLRYDLLVPIWRFADVKDPKNPYAAIDGKAYRVTLGWRDIYGNRLGKIADEAMVELSYQDPIVPVSAWPGVRAWFTAGVRAKTLRLVFVALDERGQQDGVRRLLQVVHQLEGPGVTLSIRSGLGAVTTPAKLIGKIAEWLRKVQGGASPAPLEIELPIRIDEASAHRRLDLELTMERATALCDREASADVSIAVSTFGLRPRNATAENPADGREAMLIATDVKATFPKHWGALGTDDAGTNSWWLVDQRLFPKAVGDPLMYAQPPLARAPMSVAEVSYPDLRDDGSLAEPPPRRSGHDLDSDALMATFLEKVEAFLAPPLATTVARLPSAGGKDAPFVRVMRAKHAMLLAGSPTQLLRHVGPVFVKDAKAGDDAKLAAIRMLRDACAAKLTRFHEVTSIAVQPLAYDSNTPTSWFAATGDDQLAPKLFGRMRFGKQDAGAHSLSAIRSLSHGIPLSAGSTALAFALLPPADQSGRSGDQIDLTERIAYEVTHVEREVDARIAALHPSRVAAAPAPSRWLSIVPIDAAENLPAIDVSRGKPVTAPAPLRRLPKLPGVAAPQITAVPGALPAGYAAAIKQVRSWNYGLDITGLEASDQACCRFVYNAGVGPETLPVTQTPAAPLFEVLLPALVAFDAAMAAQPGTLMRPGLWDRITTPLSGGIDLQFPKACTLFADLVEAVVAALGQVEALVAGPPALEDRFILSWRRLAKGTEASIAFVDHLPRPELTIAAQDEKPLVPHAGAGVPMIEIAFPGASAQSGTVDPTTLRKSFIFAQAMSDPPALTLRVGTMDAIKLQSIWPAASIRRNATLAGLPVNPGFVYRTSEIYLQEPRVPRLKETRSIKLVTTAKASLTERLTNALRPILAGAQGTIPVQLRLGIESVRLSQATANAGGASAFLPEPDPKVQLILEMSEADVSEAAQRLANSLTQMLQGEPLGASADVQLILSVIVRTDKHQPMLEISRIIIPMN